MSAANGTRWAAKLAAIDANLLIALDALIQEAHVTRAARRVGITQSAMSQALGRLRTQFDDPILVRAGRHMQPTPFALRIAPRLRDAIAALEQVVGDRPGFDPSAATDRFVIACVDYLSMVLAPRLHDALRARAPHTRLAIQALGTDSIAPRLEQGTVDLYLGVRGDTERGLTARSLFSDPFTVLLRPDHPLASGELTTDGYVRFPHVHVSPRQEAGSIVDRALSDRDLARHIAVEVPYFALLPGLLSDSDLLATVPASIGQLLSHQHGLRTQPPPIDLPAIDICMAWHPRYESQPAQQWLRALIPELAPKPSNPNPNPNPRQ